MTDNGAAALAAALHPMSCGVWHVNGIERCKTDAAAILGERGVFLPDGDCGHDPTHRERCHNYDPDAVIAHALAVNDEQAATIATLNAAHEKTAEALVIAVQQALAAEDHIATLRAALELVVAEPFWSNWGHHANPALDAARAALATAKEAGG